MIKIFNTNENIVLQRTWSAFILVIIVFLAIIWISAVFWYKPNPNIVALLIISIASFSLSSILIFYFFTYNESKNQQYLTTNQQFPEDLDSSKTIHDAFIIPHSVGESDVVVGFDNLIKAFKAKNYPFRIYHCYNPEDVKAVLKNECAKYIWIFGHGWCGGITFKWKPVSNGLFRRKSKNKTYLRYCDLLDNDQITLPKKLFIAQFHCNHASKKDPSRITLPEVLIEKDATPDQYYVSDFLNCPFSIWFSTRKLVKNLERTPFDANESSENEI